MASESEDSDGTEQALDADAPDEITTSLRIRLLSWYLHEAAIHQVPRLDLDGAAALIDVEGFSRLAERLFRRGSAGLEELTRTINDSTRAAVAWAQVGAREEALEAARHTAHLISTRTSQRSTPTPGFAGVCEVFLNSAEDSAGGTLVLRARGSWGLCARRPDRPSTRRPLSSTPFASRGRVGHARRLFSRAVHTSSGLGMAAEFERVQRAATRSGIGLRPV